MLEQGLGDRLPVAAFLGPGQAAEQGPHGDRLQAQVTQHAGHLGLGGRLDHTSQNHLLKGPPTPDRLTQPQAGVGPVQDLPQQGRARRLHHRHHAGSVCRSRRWC